MLPNWIPNSRILCYEWNAGFETDAPSEGFLGHANTLLNDLHRLRNPATGKQQVQELNNVGLTKLTSELE